MKMVTKTAIIVLLALSMFAVASAETSKSLPSSHMIANVPWHQQMNGLFCGEGMLEGGGL